MPNSALKSSQDSGNPQKQVDIPPSVLTAANKKNIFEQLKKIDDNTLVQALIATSAKQCKFPPPLFNKIDPLYQACLAQDDEEIIDDLKKTITKYINKGGIASVKQLLKEDFDEKNWSSEFLCSMATALNIKVKVDPVVQVAIQHGKVFWRIMKGDREVFNKFKKKGEEVNFEELDVWQMTWQQFRLFKDSGKRSGTVKITKERFVDCFEEHHQDQAELIWDELKEKGILNHRNRLSDAWRSASNASIKLDSIEDRDEDLIITKTQIVDCLKELGGTKKNKKIAGAQFINWWDEKLKLKAKVIWGKLKEDEIIDEAGKVTTLVFSMTDFIKDLNSLNYKKIVDAIYDVSTKKEYKKTISEIPNAKIFRPERSFKEWKETGRVNHKEGTDEQYCSKIWDVSVHKDLIAHRNTEDEEQSNNGKKLNYDHVPSADTLKAKAKALSKEKDELIEKYQNKIDSIETELDELEDEDDASEKYIQSLKDKLERLEYKKASAEEEKKRILSEGNGHGALWWTIAIPEKLHTQGESFFQSSKDQRKVSDNHFLKDVTAYLDILEKRPEDFSLTQDDYIKALGAFRYLYKRNVTTAVNLEGQYSIGTVPQTLFHSKDKKAIDILIRERMNGYLAKREGVKCPVKQEEMKPTYKGG